MKNYFRRWLFCIFLLLLLACACHRKVSPQPETVGPPAYDFEENAITLTFKTDHLLNLYQGISHPVRICVYQLTDPNAFNQLSTEKNGISKLLDCSRFDPSVAMANYLNDVQPDNYKKMVLDRAQGTKYVGIVVGYWIQEKEKVTKLFKIPVSGQVVEHLTKDLYLGPQRIKEIEEE
jgi:type VI secretion system VasD/TssJ family lipoprotein